MADHAGREGGAAAGEEGGLDQAAPVRPGRLLWRGPSPPPGLLHAPPGQLVARYNIGWLAGWQNVGCFKKFGCPIQNVNHLGEQLIRRALIQRCVPVMRRGSSTSRLSDSPHVQSISSIFAGLTERRLRPSLQSSLPSSHSFSCCEALYRERSWLVRQEVMKAGQGEGHSPRHQHQPHPDQMSDCVPAHTNHDFCRALLYKRMMLLMIQQNRTSMAQAKMI